MVSGGIRQVLQEVGGALHSGAANPTAASRHMPQRQAACGSVVLDCSLDLGAGAAGGQDGEPAAVSMGVWLMMWQTCVDDDVADLTLRPCPRP